MAGILTACSFGRVECLVAPLNNGESIGFRAVVDAGNSYGEVQVHVAVEIGRFRNDFMKLVG